MGHLFILRIFIWKLETLWFVINTSMFLSGFTNLRNNVVVSPNILSMLTEYSILICMQISYLLFKAIRLVLVVLQFVCNSSFALYMHI